MLRYLASCVAGSSTSPLSQAPHVESFTILFVRICLFRQWLVCWHPFLSFPNFFLIICSFCVLAADGPLGLSQFRRTLPVPIMLLFQNLYWAHCSLICNVTCRFRFYTLEARDRDFLCMLTCRFQKNKLFNWESSRPVCHIVLTFNEITVTFNLN